MTEPIIHQFPCLKDNYGFLLHDPTSGETATIDTPDAEEISRQLAARGWRLTAIWNTHWHPDHTGGNLELKRATGATIIGPAGEAGKIPGIERQVGEGDRVMLGDVAADVIALPGHTLGHIAFYLGAHGAAFAGDTLFALGCGRLFEGTPAQMWNSLSRLAALPDETRVYCAHEYTAANARFALSVDPDNEELKAYAREVAALREAGRPTVPTTIGRERRANPFLRAATPEFQRNFGGDGDPANTFARLRRKKDEF